VPADPERGVRGPRENLRRGDTVILTENDSNDGEITVSVPKEGQSIAVNDCVK
jgi:hypothetical protein